MPRRGLLKSPASGAVATFWGDEEPEAWQWTINTNSRPSDLQIIDPRVAVVGGGTVQRR